MGYSERQNNERPKDAWLAVCLSWVLPGGGQLYVGRYARGTVLIVFAGVLWILANALLVLTDCSPFVSLAINSCGFVAVYVLGCLDAFRLAKETGTEELEEHRRVGREPWAAVLLSILLPGLGHAYLRKWGLFILYLLSFFALLLLPEYELYSVIALLVFRTIACVHVRSGFGINTKREKKTLIGFAIVFLAANALGEMAIPWIQVRYVGGTVLHGGGDSMGLTIKDGDAVVINKCAYTWSSPEVGDIVVVKPPDSMKFPHISKHYRLTGICKRVVAVGGEAIQVKEDMVYVNGEQRDLIGYRELAADSSAVDEERRGTVHWVPHREFAVAHPYEVPVGRYFVLGDNIRHSTDSRDFGAVSEAQIKGKVVKICWPPKRIGTLYQD
jgi:signal peptidase I